MGKSRILRALILGACCGCSDGQVEQDLGLIELPIAGERIDGSDDVIASAEAPLSPKGKSPKEASEEGLEGDQPDKVASPMKLDGDGRIKLGFRTLSLEQLDDIELEDLLDALLYPDEYEPSDRAFPEQIQILDGKEVALEGYMIPVVWEDTEVVEFMLVRDLLACCFGGAPQADEWVSVTMPEGKGAEYFAFAPVIVQGTFHIAALEDEGGYAAGCYRMDGERVIKGL